MNYLPLAAVSLLVAILVLAWLIFGSQQIPPRGGLCPGAPFCNPTATSKP